MTPSPPYYIRPNDNHFWRYKYFSLRSQKSLLRFEGISSSYFELSWLSWTALVYWLLKCIGEASFTNKYFDVQIIPIYIFPIVLWGLHSFYKPGVSISGTGHMVVIGCYIGSNVRYIIASFILWYPVYSCKCPPSINEIYLWIRQSECREWMFCGLSFVFQ